MFSHAASALSMKGDPRMRLRLIRVLYVIATVTAFVVAAGAGRKFG